MEYIVAKTKDVASNLKTAIRICDRCFAAAIMARRALNRRMASRCISLLSYKRNIFIHPHIFSVVLFY